ncbi:BspA family leucine-rich repeat surface protein [bacterium]|nr:BspA family leucine-rich repeat surface protein [bacterium]
MFSCNSEEENRGTATSVTSFTSSASLNETKLAGNGFNVLDVDNDGVANEQDTCPLDPHYSENYPAFYKDKDGDLLGDVNERVDTCSKTAGVVSNYYDEDDTKLQKDFLFTIEVGEGDFFTLPQSEDFEYHFSVCWDNQDLNSDGDKECERFIGKTDQLATHYYPDSGTYQIKINGYFPAIYFGSDAYSALKVISVDQIGANQYRSFKNAFNGTSNMSSFTIGDSDTSRVTDFSNAFKGDSLAKVSTLDLTGLDTSSATNFTSMFNSSTVNGFVLGGLDTSNVVTMNSMFKSINVASLDLTGWDTSSVTNFHEMFRAAVIPNLNLAGLDTSKVKNMIRMFLWSTIPTVDLSTWNTSNITDMTHAFASSNLTSLNLTGSFSTSNVTTMHGTFEYLGATTTVDLSNFDTSKVTSFVNFFKGALITSIDVTSFNTSNATTFSNMFLSNNLASITGLNNPNFDTSKVESFYAMFLNTDATTIDVSNFNTSNANSMQNMFRNTGIAGTLDLSHFDTSNVNSFQEMFRDSVSVTAFDLTGFVLKTDANLYRFLRSVTGTVDVTNWDTTGYYTPTSTIKIIGAGLVIGSQSFEFKTATPVFSKQY